MSEALRQAVLSAFESLLANLDGKSWPAFRVARAAMELAEQLPAGEFADRLRGFCTVFDECGHEWGFPPLMEWPGVSDAPLRARVIAAYEELVDRLADAYRGNDQRIGEMLLRGLRAAPEGQVRDMLSDYCAIYDYLGERVEGPPLIDILSKKEGDK
jgi:hypothetical protein